MRERRDSGFVRNHSAEPDSRRMTRCLRRQRRTEALPRPPLPRTRVVPLRRPSIRLEQAAEIVEITGSKSRIVPQAFPPGYEDDPKVRQPDISRAREVLGWEPKVDRREGLRATAEYFRKRVGESDR
jgi:nucleoside-diphosphate-sugar epimerase